LHPRGASRKTWSFDARWREGGSDVERGFVLRRDPDASLLESACANGIDRLG